MCRRPSPWVAVALSIGVHGCQTSQNEGEGITKAELREFESYLLDIRRTSPPDFAPKDFREFIAYLVGFSTGIPDEKEEYEDAWGRRYLLFITSDYPEKGYLINSAGEDGVHGTSDDLSVLVEFR